MQRTVGVVLSGCGYLDGTEIQEACLTLLALDRAGVKTVPLAPNGRQAVVLDHRDGRVQMGERRHLLQESARIVRGDVQPLEEVSSVLLDAVIYPGGYGVAQNLSSFAAERSEMQVNRDVANLIGSLHAQNKPQGFICVAPILAAKVLGIHEISLTIGDDADTAAAIERFGAKHVPCEVEEICIDEQHKVVSTPAYMLGPSIAPVSVGIECLVQQVLDWL